MVIRTRWGALVALLLAAGCGGPQSRRQSNAAGPAPRPQRSTLPTAVAPPAAKGRTTEAPPAPAPGPEAFGCYEHQSAKPTVAAAPPTAATAPAPREFPKVVGAVTSVLPWRRLTRPASVGAPDLQELVALGRTFVGAGYGIKVSTDDGKTFTDASENLDTTPSGTPQQVYDLTPVGDELLAVSETALYRSVEHGKLWFRCSDPPPADPTGDPSTKRHVAFGAGVAFTSVGRRLFSSSDTGKTWFPVPARLPTVPDGLLVTERGVFAFTRGNLSFVHRSTDRGATFEAVTPALKLREGEGLTTLAWVNGKLVASTMLGALLESGDGGETWSRRWLGKGPDYQAPRPYRIWGIDGDLLLDEGLGLLRLGKKGPPVRVASRRTLALAVRGSDVFALSAEYLSRSTDAGRTFTDERVVGLANDFVEKVAASGKNIGLIAAGPTAFFSVDGGQSFQRGPEVAGVPQVAAAAAGIYFSTALDERAVVMLQPAAGGPPRPVGVGQDFGNVPPALLAAEGKSLLVYVWSRSKYLLSRDAGTTFTELPTPSMAYRDRDPGLVRGEEVILAPGGYLYRSRARGPFESLQKTLGTRREVAHARFLYVDGPTAYIVSEDDIAAWDARTDKVASLANKLPRNAEQREWIPFAAIHKKTILVQVNGRGRSRLYLSRDLGGSYQEVHGPPGTAIRSVAPSDAGILAAAKGLWVLPAQGG